MSDGNRYYISQTCGFRTISGSSWEQEYAVVDSDSGVTVALFIAIRARTQNDEEWGQNKRGAHCRARKHCHDLNQEELAAVPATNGVATVGGELVEGLVLDDLARVRSGDDLAVAHVHDDVPGAA